MTFTVRSDFPATLPATHTEYCFSCHQTGTLTAHRIDGKKMYTCSACGTTNQRLLIYDPAMVSYFDAQDRLVHEGCGVIPVRSDGKLLLFQRVKYPFLLTIPAGHLEPNEDPMVCAAREMTEEIGITPIALEQIFTGPIEGDSCMGGADIHFWHAYIAVLDTTVTPHLTGDEGREWGWYGLDELNETNAVQPLLHMLADETVREKLANLH